MTSVATIPSVAILIGGLPLASPEAAALRALRMCQCASLPAQCELNFVEPLGRFADGDWPSAGSALEVSIKGHESPLFSGQITAVEYDYSADNAVEVRVRGYDGLHPLRMRRPVRAHIQLTAAELARSLVADLGINVVNGSSGPIWQRLVQHKQTDLEFLADIAQRSGLYFHLDGTHLKFFTLEGIGPTVPLRLGESLLEAHIEANAVPCTGTVISIGWNPWRAIERQGRAAFSRCGRQIPTQMSAEAAGGSGECQLVDEIAQDDLQLESLAQAELDRRAASEVTFRGIAEGDPRLMPGAIIDVQGVARMLSGQYVVTSVTHTVDQRSGFVSEIGTAAPPPIPRPQGSVISVGKVTEVDDPEKLGRVRVVLSAYGDIETDWLQVVIPGAGRDKGMVILPDIGDQVLLVLPRGDPAQGIVLGGLYGENEPPESAVSGGAVQRYGIATPGGQRVRLDAEERTVVVDNGANATIKLAPGALEVRHRSGSAVKLADQKMSIHAETDLDIEAPGRTITIRAKSIEFEQR